MNQQEKQVDLAGMLLEFTDGPLKWLKERAIRHEHELKVFVEFALSDTDYTKSIIADLSREASRVILTRPVEEQRPMALLAAHLVDPPHFRIIALVEILKGGSA